MKSDPASENWHVDKRIPVALIVAMFAYVVGGIWWVSTIDSRVGLLERQLLSVSTVPIDISVMKIQLLGIEKSLNRLETYIDKQDKAQ